MTETSADLQRNAETAQRLRELVARLPDVDRDVVEGDEAAIEWSMRGTRDGEPFIVRGSEHYRFAGDLIAEIRQYWRFDRADRGSERVDYPYAGRGPHGG